MTTGGDGRRRQQNLHTQIERSTIPENFMTLSSTVFEKMDMRFLNSLALYLMTGSDFFEIIRSYSRHF